MTAGQPGTVITGDAKEHEMMRHLGIVTETIARQPRLLYRSLFVGPWEFRFPARR
jgi:hypothetical protein